MRMHQMANKPEGFARQAHRSIGTDIRCQCPWSCARVPLPCKKFSNSLFVTLHQIFIKGVDVKNGSLNIASIPDVFPSGDYKFYIESMIADEIWFQMTIMSSLLTSNTDTFG